MKQKSFCWQVVPDSLHKEQSRERRQEHSHFKTRCLLRNNKRNTPLVFGWLVHESVGEARQELNEGAVLTVLERVKLIYMCLPSITNLGEQRTPHNWVYV